MSLRKKRAGIVSAVAGVLVMAAASLALVGCSDDEPTATDVTSLAISLPAYDELVWPVMPPVFDGTAAATAALSPDVPDTGIACWTQGNDALLRRAFGEEQPMALYRNMHRLREAVQWLNRVRRLGDTTFTGIPADTGTFSGTISAVRIRGANIPPACQQVFGDSALALRYRISVRIAEQTQTRLDAGIKQDDTCSAMLAYYGYAAPDSAHPSAYEHSLMYAYHHQNRDSVQLRAVTVREYNDGTDRCAMWTYELTTQNQNQFNYRLTWYADDFADSNGLGSFVGAGNGQIQFALRYQQMIPATLAVPDTADPLGHVYRLFGPNYIDQGSMLSSALNDATDSAKMYRYEHLPVALKAAPSTIAASLNPWYEE